MSNLLRVCNPFEIKYSLEYMPSKSTFVGFLSGYINDLISVIEKSSNTTFDIRSKSDGEGELIDPSKGLFNGCIGLLQRNQSDFMLREISYPVATVDIEQGDIMLDSVVQFVTAYSPSSDGDKQSVPIESCFNSFDWTIWLLCLIYLFVVYWTLLSQRSRKYQSRRPRRVRGEDKYLFYQVLVHMTARGQMFSMLGSFNRLLFILLSLFSFWVLYFFSAMIKTELVVVKTPETYRTYDDLLENEVAVSFYLGSGGFTHFKYAPEGSLEKRLWDMSVKKYTEDKILFKASDDGQVDMMGDKLLGRKMSFVADSTWIKLPMKEFCGMAFDHRKWTMALGFFKMPGLKVGSLVPFKAQDPRAPVVMKGFISNKIVSEPLRRVRRTLKKMLETGFYARMGDSILNLNYLASMTGIKGGDSASKGLEEQCERSTLIMPEKQLQSIKWENVRQLITLMTYLFTFHFGVLIVELITRRWKMQ